ncbi:MAG: energy transducer TonB [Vicinamibacteria bacterium]|nr:energy transducer TonB [Vicinamibacteria bacterium]
MERNRERLFETAFLRRRTKRAVSLPLSIGLHVVLLGAVILVPLLTSQELPGIFVTRINDGDIPVIVPPPPPPATRRGSGLNNARHITRPFTSQSSAFTAPTKVTEIQPVLDPLDIFGGEANPFAVDGGFNTGQHYEPIFRDVVLKKRQEEKVVHPIGHSIKQPQRIHYVAPIYSQLALQTKVQGIVKLKCTIDETGGVVGMQVVKSIPLLDEAAMTAVSQWRYKPTLLNGVPVAISMEVTVDFRLQ